MSDPAKDTVVSLLHAWTQDREATFQALHAIRKGPAAEDANVGAVFEGLLDAAGHLLFAQVEQRNIHIAQAIQEVRRKLE